MYFCFSIRDIVRDELEPTLEGVDPEGCWSIWDMCAMVKFASICTIFTITVSREADSRKERNRQQLVFLQLLTKEIPVCTHCQGLSIRNRWVKQLGSNNFSIVGIHWPSDIT